MIINNIAYGLPSKRVGNEELIGELISRNRSRLNSKELRQVEDKLNFYLERSGTMWRYHRAEGERAVDTTVRVGEDLICKTGIDPGEIDLLIYAGVGRGWLEPAMGNLFLGALKLKNATCFDILDACASWVRSLLVAKSFLENGTYRTIMVLNSEFNFREYADFEMHRPEDLANTFSAFTIGEAATAILLTSTPDDPDFYLTFRTWGDKHDLCMIPLPHSDQYTQSGNGALHKPLRFYAQSERLVRFTVKKLVDHYKGDKKLAKYGPEIVFGHAASEASTTAWLDLAGLDRELGFRTHSRFGNTVSASIPLGLAVAEEEGRLQRGMKVLSVIGSAGVSTAYAAFTY